jgi:hypothetical protein
VIRLSADAAEKKRNYERLASGPILLVVRAYFL